MPVPQNASCTVSPELQSLADELNGRIATVSTATTTEQVKVMITETTTYVKAHKDDARTAVVTYTDCVYRATLTAEKAYLTSARMQTTARKAQGADVTKILADIDAATKIMNDSEKQYDAATKQAQKADAMKTLASSATYLQQISVALNGPVVPVSVVPSSLPSIPSSAPRSRIPRSEPPESETPRSVIPRSSIPPSTELPQSLPSSPA
jgi:hypothetical protein